MATCDNCGNSYDKMLEVTYEGTRRQFDCFECAIEAMAPRCGHCDTRIIGHGVESDQGIFCCSHCAKEAGERRLVDRV